MTPEPSTPPASPRPTSHTTVHLVRHGEVFNPKGVLYGRLPDYHLSDRGQAMAQMVADHLAGRDIALVTSSPLERAQETAGPIAQRHGLDVGTDEDLIEAGNHFQGMAFGVGDGSCATPGTGRGWSTRSGRAGASPTWTSRPG